MSLIVSQWKSPYYIYTDYIRHYKCNMEIFTQQTIAKNKYACMCMICASVRECNKMWRIDRFFLTSHGNWLYDFIINVIWAISGANLVIRKQRYVYFLVSSSTAANWKFFKDCLICIFKTFIKTLYPYKNKYLCNLPVLHISSNV